MPTRGLASLAIAFGLTTMVSASDLPPDVVARFTQRVQPLVMNRCAAGACHGGPAGHEPRFERGTVSTRPDRVHTLANMDTFLQTVGADRDPKRLVALLSVRHPAGATKTSLAAAPLTASERLTIESWLAAVQTAEQGHRRDPAVRQVSAEAPAVPSRNRFRDMLDASANPPAFEEPSEPRGVIFKQDDGTAPEPPMPPSPP
jgi:hypothetical protein